MSLHNVDLGSATGFVTFLSITAWGMATLNVVAVLVGIAVGITTIRLTMIKIENEKKRSKMLDEGIDEKE
jgi:hypothetical protein